jgi:hypothetical protein
MTNNKTKQGSRVFTAYWATTGLLAFCMLGGGLAQVLRAKWNADGMLHLGYPLYFMTIIGSWKILGVVAILLPGFTLVKEWAYAGLFFVMTGAIVSHLVSGDGVKGIIAQSIFVLLIVLSWYLRPAGRRISPVR